MDAVLVRCGRIAALGLLVAGLGIGVAAPAAAAPAAALPACTSRVPTSTIPPRCTHVQKCEDKRVKVKKKWVTRRVCYLLTY